jgi:hypothetical protein
MTDKKITELNILTGANLVDADEFVVVDISADETKAITAGQLKTVFLPIAGGTMTGNLDVIGDVSATGALIGHDSVRNTANATLGAAMGLGKVFWMEGLAYVNETGGTACDDISVSNVSPYGTGSPYHFGPALDGNLDIAVTSATNDSAAFARFWLWLASGNGHTGHLPEGKTARCDSKVPSLSGNYTLTGGPFVFDQRNLPNADGDPDGGSIVPHSGSVSATVAISSITPVVDGNGKEIVTVVTGAAHGLAVGDDIKLSSDDLVDIGYNSLETRGQMSRVRSVTSATTFIIEEQLFQTLTTNPVLTKYNWLENILWDCDVTFYGPGRRAGADTNNLEISYNGPSFTSGRRIQINNVKTKFIDYQSIVFDDCIDYGTEGCFGEVTRVDNPNSTGAIQYFLTDKNACTRGHHNNWSSVGYRHAYDHTSGSNAGVGRDILIENYNIVGTWRSAIAMHGSAFNCRVGSGKINNCYDGIDVRARGWTISGKIEMERVRSMVLLSDNAFATQIRGLRGKDVRRVVSLADTNVLIGIPEFGELDIADVSVDGCALNAIDIDTTSIPIFTEADSEVQSGTTTSMVTGDLNLYTIVLNGTLYTSGKKISPFDTLVQAVTGATAYVSNVSGSTLILQRVTGAWDETNELIIVASPSNLPLGSNSVPKAPMVAITNYNNSGMLTGGELTVDPDGGEVGVEVIRTVTQVYDAGLNTNTFSWPTAIGTPVNANATYHLRTLIDGVKITDINVRNGLGRAVQLAGNFRSPVITNVTDSSDSSSTLAPVWLRAVGGNFTRSAEMRDITTRNRVGPQIDAANTGTRINGDFADRATAVEYLSDGFIADGEHFYAGDLAFVGSASATDIADMDGVVPDGDVYPDHFGGGDGIESAAAINAATLYLSSLGAGTLHFNDESTYLMEATALARPRITWRGKATIKRKDASDVFSMVTLGAEGDDFGFFGMTFDGNRANQSNTAAVQNVFDLDSASTTNVPNSNDFVMRGCKVINYSFGGHGLHIKGFSNVDVDSNYFNDGGATTIYQAIYLRRVGSVNVLNNRFGPLVLGQNIKVQSIGNGDFVTVRGNKGKAGNRMVHLSDCSYYDIDGNTCIRPATISDTASSGIVVIQDADTGNEFFGKIRGNIIGGYSRSCLRIDSQIGVEVSGNTWLDAPILVEARNVQRVQFFGNRLEVNRLANLVGDGAGGWLAEGAINVKAYSFSMGATAPAGIVIEDTSSRFSPSLSPASDIALHTDVTVTSGDITFHGNQNQVFSDWTTKSSEDNATALLFDTYWGTSTPTYVPATGAFGSITYDFQELTYIYDRIAGMVQVWGAIRSDAVTVGTASGAVSISLPYTASGDITRRGYPATILAQDWTNNPNTAIVTTGAATLEIQRQATHGVNWTNVTAADMATGTNANELMFSATYPVA